MASRTQLMPDPLERRPRTGAGMAGLGMAVPAREVSNTPIAERLGVEPEWIEARTGISARRVAPPDQSLTDLATEAAQAALADSGTDPADLDLVLAATTTADELLPTAAPQVAERVGASGAGALDLGAACSGFVSALGLAAGYVESRRAERVLVVGADLMTRITDPDDRPTAGLFADGAGAAVVTADAEGALGPAVSGSDAATGAPLIRVEHSDRQIRMDGLETYRNAVRRLGESAIRATVQAGLELPDIDLFVFHQANTRIIRAVGEQLELDPDRVIDCIGRYGNTSAATIPIALCEARHRGRLKPGDRVLLAAFGAGFTWSAMVVEMGGGRA